MVVQRFEELWKDCSEREKVNNRAMHWGGLFRGGECVLQRGTYICIKLQRNKKKCLKRKYMYCNCIHFIVSVVCSVPLITHDVPRQQSIRISVHFCEDRRAKPFPKINLFFKLSWKRWGLYLRVSNPSFIEKSQVWDYSGYYFFLHL